MIKYEIKIPSESNKFVAAITNQLDISSKALLLDVIAGPNDNICECFENVRKQVEFEGGDTVFGWQLWEHPYMIEAEFHAVWRRPDGALIDITPKDHPEIKKILFLEDMNRKFDGTQTDNFRINTTTNRLADDIIEIEKARFRFLNKDGRDKIIGLVNDDDNGTYDSLIKLSTMLEQILMNGGDINSPCICNSGDAYNNCHRGEIRNWLIEI